MFRNRKQQKRVAIIIACVLILSMLVPLVVAAF